MSSDENDILTASIEYEGSVSIELSFKNILDNEEDFRSAINEVEDKLDSDEDWSLEISPNIIRKGDTLVIAHDDDVGNMTLKLPYDENLGMLRELLGSLKSLCSSPAAAAGAKRPRDDDDEDDAGYSSTGAVFEKL